MKHLFTLSERLKGRGRGSVTSAISATSASAFFCKLVGMVNLFMPFMKATKRQSDTTFFAESLKSLMSIFAESAESAKPIFANRGVKDVRVSLAQYPTNIQRISNLYLTPNRYLTRFAAVFTLVFVLGVGNVWGATWQLVASDFSSDSYDANAGDHTKGGITYNVSKVMNSSSNIQFQASNGTIYNKTAMPGNITKITAGGGVTIKVGTTENPSSGTTVTSGNTISGSY
ncbi:MAG: hypothetical protein J5937_02595, partial [Paludibacteraceae bacterium]|nr:hypothetical protein [Paludibacteraceae bacterium]